MLLLQQRPKYLKDWKVMLQYSRIQALFSPYRGKTKHKEIE